VERKRASAKDRLAKHREKIYSNPELLEEYRRKERERLGDRVIIGKNHNFDKHTIRTHTNKHTHTHKCS
jgi:UDP-glucose 6-dehydrogenase